MAVGARCAWGPPCATTTLSAKGAPSPAPSPVRLGPEVLYAQGVVAKAKGLLCYPGIVPDQGVINYARGLLCSSGAPLGLPQPVGSLSQEPAPVISVVDEPGHLAPARCQGGYLRAASTAAAAVGALFAVARPRRRRARGRGLGGEDIEKAEEPRSRGSTVWEDGDPLPWKTPLRIHFLYASPFCEDGSSERLPELDAQAEFRAVEDAVQHSGAATQVQLNASVATADALSRLGTATPDPRGGCDWWHLAAHTERQTGRLILEDEDGSAHPVPASAASVTVMRPPLGALVLACASQSIGAMLLQCGALFALVAVGPLLDAAARTFTAHFYRVLLAAWPGSSNGSRGADGRWRLEGAAVRTAFRVARDVLRAAPRPDLRAEACKLVLLEPNSSLGNSLPPALPAPCDSIAKYEGASIVPRQRAKEAEPLGAYLLQSKPSAPPLPWGLRGQQEASADELPAGPSRSFSSSSLGLSPGAEQVSPEDCEDFVGRAQELLALMRLLGSQGRRLAVLHGPEGIGKSALCAEFCRFATAPGRRFSAVRGGAGRWRQRLAFISLRGAEQAHLQGAAGGAAGEAAAVLQARAAVMAGLAALQPGGATGGVAVGSRTCLVVDHAEPELGWRDQLAAELLTAHPNLCLLLVRRTPLYRLDGSGGDRWKPVNVELPALASHHAAQVFLRRVHRPLTEDDFTSAAAGGRRTASSPARPLQQREPLLQRLASHPALAAGRGNPQRVVRLASAVTPQLPSLYDIPVAAVMG